jgi:Carboxypeptidase regulatory-like domain/TonB-dependent Receptor Plug Domain
MIDRRARALILAATLVLAGAYEAVFTPMAHAQTSKGILTGTVRDASGAVVPNAKIHVQNEATTESRDLMSNESGEYRVDALAPGLYTIRVESPGFQPTTVQKLDVKPSVVTSFDASLQLGSESTTVNVTANTNLINTENAQQATTISTAEIKNVPIFSLNPIELVKTAPGVQLVDQDNFSNGVGIQVNGSRPRSNSFLIDGQDINDPGIAGQAIQPQIPDMYQNVTVITNSATAEYGGAGGGIVNLITKGGTNQYHGTAWELYSGSGINALDGQQRQLPHTRFSRTSSSRSAERNSAESTATRPRHRICCRMPMALPPYSSSAAGIPMQNCCWGCSTMGTMSRLSTRILRFHRRLSI